MIVFKEEIQKYKPILEIDDVESAIESDETKDVMDLLQYITGKITRNKEQESV